MLEYRIRLYRGICLRILKKCTNCNANMGRTQKVQRVRLPVQRKMIWTNNRTGSIDRGFSWNLLSKQQKVHENVMSGNKCRNETLANNNLQVVFRSGLKAQAILCRYDTHLTTMSLKNVSFSVISPHFIRIAVNKDNVLNWGIEKHHATTEHLGLT